MTRPHVADYGLARHRTERDDLRDGVTSILLRRIR